MSAETAAEHAIWAREWVRQSEEAVDHGVKTEREHARTVRATLMDALTFLERLGDATHAAASSGTEET